MTNGEPSKPYFAPGLRKSQAELDWESSCKIARAESKSEWSVSPGCSVPQRDGPTLYEGDQVDPDRIEGGLQQVRKWARPNDGYVLQTDERTWRTNAGEYEFNTLRAFTTGHTVYGPGLGFNAEELDQPGEPEYQAIGSHGKLITRPGRPPLVGAELAESLIVRGLVERRTLRAKVASSFRKRRAAASDAESAD